MQSDDVFLNGQRLMVGVDGASSQVPAWALCLRWRQSRFACLDQRIQVVLKSGLLAVSVIAIRRRIASGCDSVQVRCQCTRSAA